MWPETILLFSAATFLLGALRFLILFLGLRLTLRKARQSDHVVLFHDFAMAMRGAHPAPDQMGGGSKSQSMRAPSSRARRASG